MYCDYLIYNFFLYIDRHDDCTIHGTFIYLFIIVYFLVFEGLKLKCISTK